MEQVTLRNGLRVMLAPDDRVRTACFGVWVGAGSCYEDDTRSGVSHFIEHILFKGTGRRSARDIAEEMDMLGGQIYAYTAKECTSFYVRTLSEHVDKGFEILCDMLSDPAMREEDVDAERGVILEEISMSEDEPEDLVTEQMYAQCWKNCAYGKEILGTRDTVNALHSSELRTFMKDAYTASRMVISIGGRFDRASFLALCERYFGDLPGDGAPFRPQLQVDYSPACVLTPRDLEQTHICLCVPGLHSESENRYALGMLNSIMGGSSSSRLFQKIREELGLAYAVYSDAVCYTGGGVVGMYLAVSPDVAERAVSEAMDIFRAMGQGVSDKEFERTREHFKTSLIMSLESVSSRVANMGTKALLRGKVKTDDELLGEIDRVSKRDVEAMGRCVAAALSELTVSVVGPVRDPSFYETLRT